jgi:hypothetical protein
MPRNRIDLRQPGLPANRNLIICNFHDAARASLPAAARNASTAAGAPETGPGCEVGEDRLQGLDAPRQRVAISVIFFREAAV